MKAGAWIGAAIGLVLGIVLLGLAFRSGVSQVDPPPIIVLIPVVIFAAFGQLISKVRVDRRRGGGPEE